VKEEECLTRQGISIGEDWTLTMVAEQWFLHGRDNSNNRLMESTVYLRLSHTYLPTSSNASLSSHVLSVRPPLVLGFFVMCPPFSLRAVEVVSSRTHRPSGRIEVVVVVYYVCLSHGEGKCQGAWPEQDYIVHTHTHKPTCLHGGALCYAMLLARTYTERKVPCSYRAFHHHHHKKPLRCLVLLHIHFGSATPKKTTTIVMHTTTTTTTTATREKMHSHRTTTGFWALT